MEYLNARFHECWLLSFLGKWWWFLSLFGQRGRLGKRRWFGFLLLLSFLLFLLGFLGREEGSSQCQIEFDIGLESTPRAFQLQNFLLWLLTLLVRKLCET